MLTWCRSSITYFPLGFRSARRGVVSLMRWKSSSVRSTPTARAMARKCSTALVEPPRAMTTVSAFLMAALVMISRGRSPDCSIPSTALQHKQHQLKTAAKLKSGRCP